TLLAAGVLVFAWPAFVFIAEPSRPPRPAPRLGEVFVRLLRSWRRAATFPGMVRFLVGRFLYTDAINTLIGGFLAIYAIQELGLRSEEHTSELQSRENLVCRLLLEKKKKQQQAIT